MMFFATVRALSGGDLFGLVTVNTFLRRMGQTTHPTPDGVFIPYLETVVPLTLVASHRLALVGVQGVGVPAGQVQLGRCGPSCTRSICLVGMSSLPESLGGEHVGVSFHRGAELPPSPRLWR